MLHDLVHFLEAQSSAKECNILKYVPQDHVGSRNMLGSLLYQLQEK